jgi:hypothetical protein
MYVKGRIKGKMLKVFKEGEKTGIRSPHLYTFQSRNKGGLFYVICKYLPRNINPNYVISPLTSPNIPLATSKTLNVCLSLAQINKVQCS